MRPKSDSLILEKNQFMRVVVSVQVRMGSERLPGKVMRCFDGKPMIWHLVNRLKQCKELDEVVVATGQSVENDVVESFCQSEGIICYRGSDEDVLDRLLGSLRSQETDVGVVVYGDNPLIDPAIVDQHVKCFREKTTYDWIGNDLKTTFPPGMEVEVFCLKALTDSASRAVAPSIREHGTLFIRQNPSIYRLHNVEAHGILRRPDIHLGVDTLEDAEVLEVVIDHFGRGHTCSLERILEFMDQHPELIQKNRNVPRRWREYREG